MTSYEYPKTRGMTLSALFAAFLAISSLIEIPIPFSPVPITLQVLIVFLIAPLLGPRYGAFTCLIYLIFGTIGLPVFAGGTSGLAILLGPTGGYLFGFPLGAAIGGLVCGNLSPTKRLDLIRISLGVIATLATIYSIGIIWLSVFLRISIAQAILLGAVPFIIVDIFKTIVAIPIALRFRWTSLHLPVHIHSNVVLSTGSVQRDRTHA